MLVVELQQRLYVLVVQRVDELCVFVERRALLILGVARREAGAAAGVVPRADGSDAEQPDPKVRRRENEWLARRSELYARRLPQPLSRHTWATPSAVQTLVMLPQLLK